MILYPDLAASSQFALSAMTAVVIRDTVQHFTGLPTAIKWPNDIYISTSKVAGILIQNAVSGKMLQHSVIGIGLNVNEMGFPDDIEAPTSLRLATGQNHNVQEVFTKLLDNMNRRYALLDSDSTEAIVQEYRTHMYRIGELANFRRLDDDSHFQAIITGVDQYGRLLLEHDNNTFTYTNSEIKYIP